MEQVNTSRFKILSGNGLKLIAIVTMLIDHIGAAIVEQGILRQYNFSIQAGHWWQIDKILRTIGRVSFPMFCFLLVEGFLHTRDVKKYACRLLAFSVISEIPFDLAFQNTWFAPDYQNVYFTLFLGLVALIGIEANEESPWKQAVVMAVTCLAAWWLKTDYGAFGVFFIILIYLTRYHYVQQTILGSMALIWEAPAILAFIPIRMYNGTRGKWNLKYIFYGFYPAHILLLWGIRVWLF